ncbi:MAG: TIGR04141 family sporadically distributed protein, partial [Pseudomonadales bacterium]
VSTFSSQLSHLFNQGTNAIELLKLEPESDKKLRALIKGKVSAADFDGFTAPLDDQKFRVVFAIVTHKDKTALSANLPLFSRISLMRSMKALKVMSVDGQYGFVKDVSPKSAGKKKATKKGKKKARGDGS